MTTKYNRNTIVPFGTLSNYGQLTPAARERMEALLDPEFLYQSSDSSDSARYPLYSYTEAVAFSGLEFASVLGDGEVLIREAAFNPGNGGKLLLRTSGGSFTGEVPVACATDPDSLIGETLDGVHLPGGYEIIDVYQAPRSGRLFVAFARKDEEQ
ncbi:hypothetical protein [uncultured Rothia sp.]|uniref:hypothetical protein n=1 Tax=uncultured Rothia sp. TaxID=316088 RepID=UPI0028896B69|nr:hypothetical protein [uncultured Rothia sp.]